MADGTKKKSHFGYFPARLLWAIEPIVQHHRNTEMVRMLDGNVFLAPSQSGGALIGAVHGHAMAVFHAPDAYCSGPMTLDIPDAAFAAAEPPAPVCFNYCGSHYHAEVPEWMQPGTCFVHDAGIFIQPKMRHPQWAGEDNEFQPCLFQRTSSVGTHTIGADFRLKEGSPIDWRKALALAVSDTTAPAGDVLAFSPQLVNLFSRIEDMCWDESPEDRPRTFHRATGNGGKPGAIVLTIEGRPDFVGLYMPMKMTEPQSVSWSFLHEEKANG
ncbi:hypothetical protein [Sinorhizobium meliloti]|uniref:hypothetical protein n=1 Tax=Rhizobium meliloti TaxID=382 RepID=UPI000FD8D9FD|nr:hypothetical protein [Sinorhizobium meliloti]RVE84025.1 hypothetical protein CN238_25280 [Sinorhizobium meliloti]RVH28529.1 hypothetical protein CN214_17495 [Sinorhizobium meliloti]